MSKLNKFDFSVLVKSTDADADAFRSGRLQLEQLMDVVDGGHFVGGHINRFYAKYECINATAFRTNHYCGYNSKVKLDIKVGIQKLRDFAYPVHKVSERHETQDYACFSRMYYREP